MTLPIPGSFEARDTSEVSRHGAQSPPLKTRQRKFTAGLLARVGKKGQDAKPVDFTKLKKLHDAGQYEKFSGLAQLYLAWAEKRPKDAKAQDRLPQLKGMIAEAERKLAGNPPERRSDSSSVRSSSNASSDKSETSARPSVKQLKNAVKRLSGSTKSKASSPPQAPPSPPPSSGPASLPRPMTEHRIDRLERARHVSELRSLLPDDHPALGLSPYDVLAKTNERYQTVYRLLPLTKTKTEDAQAQAMQALGAAMASTLHDEVRKQTSLDWCLPRATFVQPADGKQATVIVDAPLDHPVLDAGTQSEPLQRALLGQWMLGRPHPRWCDFNRDPKTGELRARDVQFYLDRGGAANREEPSQLFRNFNRAGGSPMAGEPLDPRLAQATLALNMQSIRQAMLQTRDRMETHLPENVIVTAQGVERLLGPLYALRAAIQAPEGQALPLEKLMADAAKRLRQMDLEADGQRPPRQAAAPRAGASTAVREPDKTAAMGRPPAEEPLNERPAASAPRRTAGSVLRSFFQSIGSALRSVFRRRSQ